MQLKGKTVFFLGSSIVYGDGGVSFAEVLAQKLGFTMVKEALSGTTLADINKDSYVSRLNKHTQDRPDLFVCQLSTNDPWQKVDIAETEKAIRYIIDFVNEHFGCKIAFFTTTNFSNPPYEEHIKMLYELKKEYGFEVLDLYNNEYVTGENIKNRNTYLKPDGVHPTTEGYTKLWAPMFIEFFEGL